MRRTDAILTALRQADGYMRPGEIRSTPNAASRDDTLNAVTATLAHLRTQGRVAHTKLGYRAIITGH
jgi:hypothetical protein